MIFTTGAKSLPTEFFYLLIYTSKERNQLATTNMLDNLLIPFHRWSLGSEISHCCREMKWSPRSTSKAHILLPNASSPWATALSGKVFCPVFTCLSSNHGQFSLCAHIRKLNRKSTSVLPWFNSQRGWLCRISRWGLQKAGILTIKLPHQYLV